MSKNLVVQCSQKNSKSLLFGWHENSGRWWLGIGRYNHGDVFLLGPRVLADDHPKIKGGLRSSEGSFICLWKTWKTRLSCSPDQLSFYLSFSISQCHGKMVIPSIIGLRFCWRVIGMSHSKIMLYCPIMCVGTKQCHGVVERACVLDGGFRLPFTNALYIHSHLQWCWKVEHFVEIHRWFRENNPSHAVIPPFLVCALDFLSCCKVYIRALFISTICALSSHFQERFFFAAVCIRSASDNWGRLQGEIDRGWRKKGQTCVDDGDHGRVRVCEWNVYGRRWNLLYGTLRDRNAFALLLALTIEEHRVWFSVRLFATSFDFFSHIICSEDWHFSMQQLYSVWCDTERNFRESGTMAQRSRHVY